MVKRLSCLPSIHEHYQKSLLKASGRGSAPLRRTRDFQAFFPSYLEANFINTSGWALSRIVRLIPLSCFLVPSVRAMIVMIGSATNPQLRNLALKPDNSRCLFQYFLL